MPEAKSRGSTKLGAMSPEKLMSAVSVARESYLVERWWKYGQPAIDLIAGTINVRDIGAAGQLVTHLAGLQGKAMQVSFEVFPYGIINPDGVRINVRLEQSVGR
jgi:hypothetical protein